MFTVKMRQKTYFRFTREMEKIELLLRATVLHENVY